MEASRRAETQQERRDCRKKERKLQRKWMATRMLHQAARGKTGQHRLQTLICDGVETTDREKWRQELGAHCTSMYHDPAETRQVQEERVNYLRCKQRSLESD
eukprot:8161771-Karenia_brevis.AAC.1